MRTGSAWESRAANTALAASAGALGVVFAAALARLQLAARRVANQSRHMKRVEAMTWRIPLLQVRQK